MKNNRTVGIIGAGIAGLACAHTLRSSGVQVKVLEKSRGEGGRVATRRIDSGVTFDHGAQHFTVRDAAFRSQVKRWREAGTANLWLGRIVALKQGIVTDLHEPTERYVGVPGMNAIAKSLATGLDVHTNVTAQSIRRSDGAWQVQDILGIQYGPFDLLISTAPPPQTAKLFGDQSAMIESSLLKVTMDPCWAVLLQMCERLQTPSLALRIASKAAAAKIFARWRFEIGRLWRLVWRSSSGRCFPQWLGTRRSSARNE